MTSLPITSLTAAMAAIMLAILTVMVGTKRLKTQTSLGTGTDDNLLRRVRAHGNFTEYVPIALVLMALSELQGAGQILVCTTAVLLLSGRASHALGLLNNISNARKLGMITTLASILTPAVYLLMRAL